MLSKSHILFILTNPSTRFINSVVYTGVALTGALTAVGGITVED